MSIAASLKADLPLLRRYARALVGTQERGDACVEAMLNALLDAPASLPRDMEMRLALLRMLTCVVTSMPVDDQDGRASILQWENAAARRLASLKPAARQVFILVFVEGFGIEESALVLDREEDQVRSLLASATNEIASQISTDVLIIEDEPIIAMELEQMIERLGHRVCGIARTHGEALAIHARSHVGLVLADIRLADGTSGINAVSDMLSRIGASPPIIFVTAYPERLLSGDRPEPTFLITKPFLPESVKATVSQTLFFDGVPEAVA